MYDDARGVKPDDGFVVLLPEESKPESERVGGRTMKRMRTRRYLGPNMARRRVAILFLLLLLILISQTLFVL